MATKWTEQDIIDHVKTLTNPFLKAGIQSPNQKPKLSEVINSMAVRGNGETETPVIQRQEAL